MTFASNCQVWPLKMAEFDLGVSSEESWVLLIGVIKFLSSKLGLISQVLVAVQLALLLSSLALRGD